MVLNIIHYTQVQRAVIVLKFGPERVGHKQNRANKAGDRYRWGRAVPLSISDAPFRLHDSSFNVIKNTPCVVKSSFYATLKNYMPLFTCFVWIILMCKIIIIYSGEKMYYYLKYLSKIDFVSQEFCNYLYALL